MHKKHVKCQKQPDLPRTTKHFYKSNPFFRHRLLHNPCRRYQRPYYIAFDIFSNRHISGAPLTRCAVHMVGRMALPAHMAYIFQVNGKDTKHSIYVSFSSTCFLNYNCSYFLRCFLCAFQIPRQKCRVMCIFQIICHILCRI